jgi:hypothetical protein
MQFNRLTISEPEIILKLKDNNVMQNQKIVGRTRFQGMIIPLDTAENFIFFSIPGIYCTLKWIYDKAILQMANLH